MAQIIKYFWRIMTVLTVGLFVGLFVFLGFPMIADLVQFSLSERLKFTKVSRVEIYWGRRDFERRAWKEKKERASQSVDLVKSGRLLGMTNAEVRDLLGEPDGDYIATESILTYRVISSTVSVPDKVEGSRWSLVLYPDQAGRVELIRFYRGCCD